MIEIIKLHHSLPAKFEWLYRKEDHHSICGIWFRFWKWGLKIQLAESGRAQHCADCSKKIDIDEWYYNLCPECWSIYSKEKWPVLND